MKRKLNVTLEIEVEDLSEDQISEIIESFAYEFSDEEIREEFSGIGEYRAEEVAKVLSYLGNDWAQDELWAGSDVYARFTDVKVINSSWKD